MCMCARRLRSLLRHNQTYRLEFADPWDMTLLIHMSHYFSFRQTQIEAKVKGFRQVVHNL